MTDKDFLDFLDIHQVGYVSTFGESEMGIGVSDYVQRAPVARTKLLNIDGALAMAVIPSDHRPDLEGIRELIDAETVRPAADAEVRRKFPGCEPAAVPPVGMLFGVRVFISDELSRESRIGFLAGSRATVVEMDYADYFRLVRPVIAPISAADTKPEADAESAPPAMAEAAFLAAV